MAKKKATGKNNNNNKGKANPDDVAVINPEAGTSSDLANSDLANSDLENANLETPEPGTEEPESAGVPLRSSGEPIAQTQKSDKKAAKDKKRSAPSEQGFNLVTFLKGTKEELDKVVWPSRQELISESVAVLLMVTLSATVIYFVDNLLNWAARQVFG